MDVHAVIPQVLAGNGQAYAQVVEHYQHLVYTVCDRVLRNQQDAEEATQDTFVKAYQHLGTFGGSSKFSTWLYSIAYRTAISQLRKRRNDTDSVDELAQHPAAEREDGNTHSEIRHHLEQALATLPPEDAALLSFFHLEELSVEEIVTVTGLGASNVKVKLHRGRKKLLEALNKALGPEARELLLEHG